MQAPHRVLRLDHRGRRTEVDRLLDPPDLDRLPPGPQRIGIGLELAVRPKVDHGAQHAGAIADDGHLDADGLVDGRGIDVHVDLARHRREGVEPAGDAVVEARADVHHHVAIVHGVVGLVGAVHAEHAEPGRSRGRVAAEAHEGRGDREAGQRHQLAQQLGGLRPRVDDAAAGVEHRALGRRHQHHRLLDPRHVRVQLRPIGLVLGHRLLLDVGAAGELHVLGDVDDHRARAPAACHVEGLVQDARQVGDRAHQVIVLRAVPRDADGVAFLERVGADEVRRHLPRDADQRDRVEQRVGQAGDDVGGAGARGHQQHADLARRAGIALGGMGRTLLVAHQDVLDVVLAVERVVDRQHGAAGVAEQRGDALVLQRLHDHLRAAHLADRAVRGGLLLGRLLRMLGHGPVPFGFV